LNAEKEKTVLRFPAQSLFFQRKVSKSKKFLRYVLIAACYASLLSLDSYASTPDFRNDVIYMIVTDRFANGNPANDNGDGTNPLDNADPNNIKAWHGGDFAGITQKINSGYFNQLGMTAIWISPFLKQIPGVIAESGELRTGYAGYFNDYPSTATMPDGDYTVIDPHLGTQQDLVNLVKAAHEHSLKVIFDIVPNHTGYDSNLLVRHPEWFNPQRDPPRGLYTAWLHGLPDLNQEIPKVAQFDDAMVNYQKSFHPDGFRIDAERWMFPNYIDHLLHQNNTLTAAACKNDPVGQTYGDYATGPCFEPAIGGPSPLDVNTVWSMGDNKDPTLQFLYGSFANAAIDYHLQDNIQFNLTSDNGYVWYVMNVFNDKTGLYKDDRFYSADFWPPGKDGLDPTKVVTRIDDHDSPRFITACLNKGDSLQEAEARLAMALKFLFTARGIPNIYYGTEIALQGGTANADDARRDMDFSRVALSPFSYLIKYLTFLRQTFPALTHGKQVELYRPSQPYAPNEPQVIAYARVLPHHKTVISVLNNNNHVVDLSHLNGGGIPLQNLLPAKARVRPILGLNFTMEVTERDLLIGTMQPHSLVSVVTIE
jgi:neopullulanase